MNPLSEPVSISRIWAEMLILPTKVNLRVQSRENSCGTSRVISAMLFFVWFWSFCKSEQDHVSGTLLCKERQKWEGCSCMGTIAHTQTQVKRTNNSQNTCHCVWHVTDCWCIYYENKDFRRWCGFRTRARQQRYSVKCPYFSDPWMKIPLTHAHAGKPSLLVLWWVGFSSSAIPDLSEYLCSKEEDNSHLLIFSI